MLEFVRSLNLEEKLSPRKNVEIIWFYIFLPALILYLYILSDYLNSKPNIGSIEVFHPSFEKLIYSSSQMEVIATGLRFTEGPVWIDDEAASIGYLMFSDTIANKIYKWEEGKGMFTVGKSIYIDYSGCSSNLTYCSLMAEPGTNGMIRKQLAKNDDLDLIACMHGERVVALVRENGTFAPIATSYNGKRFNSPNDLVWSPEGNLYFTDPIYGLMDKKKKIVGQELQWSGIYMIKAEDVALSMLFGLPTQKVHLLDKSMSNPNGLSFSPDYSKLYVSNSDDQNPYWKVFEVTDEGLLANGEIFFNALDDPRLAAELNMECVSPNNKNEASQAVHTESRGSIQSPDDITAKIIEDGNQQQQVCGPRQKRKMNPGVPDGLKVDIHGNLFASGPGGVLVISPEGQLIGRFKLDDRVVSNVAFGGDGRLYLTAEDFVLRTWVRTKPSRIIATATTRKF